MKGKATRPLANFEKFNHYKFKIKQVLPDPHHCMAV